MSNPDLSSEVGVAPSAEQRSHLRVIDGGEQQQQQDGAAAPQDPPAADEAPADLLDGPEQSSIDGRIAIDGCIIPDKYELWKDGLYQVTKPESDKNPDTMSPSIDYVLPAPMRKRRKQIIGVPLWLAELGVGEGGALSARVAGRSTIDDKWVPDGWVDHTLLGQSRRLAECLRPYGIPATSGNAAGLVQYFAAVEEANAARLQRTFTTTREGYRATTPDAYNFMHAGRWYGPGKGSVDRSFANEFSKAMTRRGSFGLWKSRYARVREFGVAARMALAASFGAPLARVLGVRPFWLFVCGPSMSGKTALAKFAMSVWGDPGGLKRTFNTTINGVLAHFNYITDLPLHLDEQQVADKNSDVKLDLSRLVYAVESGVSRSRATRDGQAQPSITWHTIVIANGEEDLVPETDLGGQKARVLSVSIDYSDERSKIAAEFHQTDGQVAWGHAGRWWLERIVVWLNDPALKAKLIASYQQVREEVAALNADVHPARAAQLALLVWTSRLTSCMLLGTDKPTAHAEAIADAREVIEKLPQTYQEGLGDKALAVLRSHVMTSKRQIGFGVEDGMMLLPEPAGDVLRAAGFPATRIWREFADRGWLVEENGKTKIWRRKDAGRHRGYVVRNTVWIDGGDVAEGGAPVAAPPATPEPTYEQRLAAQDAVNALGEPQDA